jgi:hypothetical protein
MRDVTEAEFKQFLRSHPGLDPLPMIGRLIKGVRYLDEQGNALAQSMTRNPSAPANVVIIPRYALL